MSLSGLLSSRMKVQRLTSTKNNSGGFANSWSDLYSGVACRVEDASAATVERFARLEMDVTHEVFHQQAGVRNGMRLVVDGRTFKVQSTTGEPGTGNVPTYFITYAQEDKGLA